MFWLDLLRSFFEQIVMMGPRLLGAIIVLIIGWAVGRGLGAAVSRILDRAGVDDALRKTSMGKAIEKSGISLPKFFNILVRVFVYLIAVLAAVNILEIEILSQFMTRVIEYLPSFIAGIFILIFGLMAADFVGDAITAVGREAKIEYAGIASAFVRTIFYLVVIIIGLSTMKIDVNILYTIVTAAAWGFAGAIAIGGGLAIGFGLREIVAKKAEEWMKRAEETAKALEKRGEEEKPTE